MYTRRVTTGNQAAFFLNAEAVILNRMTAFWSYGFNIKGTLSWNSNNWRCLRQRLKRAA